MLTEAQIQAAILLNRHHAQFLCWEAEASTRCGWSERLPAILTVLGLNASFTERSFALAVSAWQKQQGIAPADGIIDQQTWKVIQPETLISADPALIGAQFPSGTLQPGPTPTPSTVSSSPLLMPGRAFMFVVVETLPEIGARNLVRKVAVIPKDFRLRPRNPLARLSPAEHALGNPNSQWLSASNRSFGAPNMQGRPLLIDMDAIRRAGGKIVSEAELVADLQRYAKQSPGAAGRVQKLISAIRGFEGETLIGTTETPRNAVRQVSRAHSAYVRAAEDLWAQFEAKQISRAELEKSLSGLDDAYKGSRALGRVGRVFMIAGVVFTAVDMGYAVEQSVEEQSFRPVAAESVRQVGGWGGAIAGAKLGGIAGAAVGIETGPGAIVTGAIGAIIFGAAGYFGADWVADMISEN